MIDKLTNYFVGTAYAQSSPDWFGIFNPFQYGTRSDARGTFLGVMGTVMGWVLAIVAIIAFVYLMMSGISYITAGGDSEKATKARNGIINAIIGIVVVVLSFFILRFATNLAPALINRG